MPTRSIVASLRLLVFAAIAGALTGLISHAFLWSLSWATRTRVAHGWLVWLLPLCGLVVAAAYFYKGGRAKGGTPAVIEQANVFTHGVPARMAPMVFGGSIASHLVGASVGREGAALQMAGSVTDTVAALGRLDNDDRRTLIAASLAGGWGAVFGVPLTGIVFTLQVTRHHRRRALMPAVVSAFVGLVVVNAFDNDFGPRPRLSTPDWSVGLPFKLMLAGVVFGLLGRVFVSTLKLIRFRMGHHVRWPPLRAVFGGLATLGLMGLFGRDYLGLSIPLLDDSFGGTHIEWWVPLVKLLFTAVALGTGFVGGEVAPLIVMGGTAGAALAPGLHADHLLLTAAGSSTVFASAASVALTGVVLTVEQFGWHALVPALIVCGVARVVAGRPGLYVHH